MTAWPTASPSLSADDERDDSADSEQVDRERLAAIIDESANESRSEFGARTVAGALQYQEVRPND